MPFPPLRAVFEPCLCWRPAGGRKPQGACACACACCMQPHPRYGGRAFLCVQWTALGVAGAPRVHEPDPCLHAKQPAGRADEDAQCVSVCERDLQTPLCFFGLCERASSGHGSETALLSTHWVTARSILASVPCAWGCEGDHKHICRACAGALNAEM